VPAAKGEVLPIDNAEFTGSVKFMVVEWLDVSVTVTTKLSEPALGGVPCSKPAAVRVSQPGRLDEVQLYGAVPPDAANCWEYGEPTVPVGRGEVFEMAKAATTGKVKLSIAVWLSESVTVKENVKVPAAGGVPVKNPFVVSVSQLGREEAVQVNGPVPPDAVN
jgi:hypothetical protein